MRAAALEALEARVVGPLGAADGVCERAPLLVVAGGDGDPAVVVDGGEDAARRGAGAAVAAAVGLLAAERHLPDVRPEAGDGGLELRDVDPLPGAAALAVQQRADDRRHRVVARDVVGQRHGRHRGLAVGVAGEVVEAGERGQVGAPRLVVAVRPLAAAVAGHAHVDDVRVHRPHVLVVDPQRVDGRDAEVREEHVALLDDAVEELTALGRLELEADAALLRVEGVVAGEHVAAREPDVGRRPCGHTRAHRGAARARLDLDHVGAEVGEVAPGERPGDRHAALDDAYPFERAWWVGACCCHLVLPVWRAAYQRRRGAGSHH